jgi:hypothetical protein
VTDVAIHPCGPNAVDWGQRIDIDRLRRVKNRLERWDVTDPAVALAQEARA